MSKANTPSKALQAKLLLACQRLDSTTDDLSLSKLGSLLEMSPSHFQRVFSRWIGLSPKRYAMARRDEKVRALLGQGMPVTQAFLQAGYETPSRFYEGIESKLGMRPSQYRSGAAGVPLRVSVGSCSLGEFLVGISEKGVCAITLGEDAQGLLDDFQERFSAAAITPASAADDQTVARVVGLLEGAQPVCFPLDIRGTIFQQQVWQALCRIPKGKTASYAEVARAIGKPSSHRAVAQACSANALAVAIPCHRVVRSDGGLSGYRWGVERKRQLLDREALDIA